MKTIKLFGVFGILFGFSSCISLHKSTPSTAVYAPNARIKPIYADVEVKLDKKLVGMASATYFLMFRIDGERKYAAGVRYSIGADRAVLPIIGMFMTAGKRRSQVRAAAAYNAMSNSDGDILVNPQFTIEEKNYLIVKQYSAEVTGYAGYFAAFYQKDEQDIEQSVADYLDEGRAGKVDLRIDFRGSGTND